MYGNRLSGLLLVLALTLTSAPHAWAQGDAKAQARAHYKKAKNAFEDGKYKLALGEYQSAYRLMKLSGFLFNIGQCYRNMQKPKKAIIAFKRYLKDKPRARNREAVEGLIAELEAEIELKQPIPGHKPDGSGDPAVDPDADPDRDPRGTPKPDASTPKKAVLDYKPDAGVYSGVNLTATRPRPVRPRPGATPIYKKWWFWTIIGVAVAGGAVGTYFGIKSSEPDMPQSDLGVLDFSR